MAGIDARVAELACLQHGVISRRQLIELGLTQAQLRYRVLEGLLVPLHPSAFRVAGAPPTWEGQLMAAHLWLGPRSHVSHRAAARLYRLDAFAEHEILELTLRGAGRLRVSGVKIHRTKKVAVTHIRKLNGFACAGPERLMLELAAVVSGRLLEAAFDNMVLKGLTTHHRVRRYLQSVRASGMNGVSAVERLLDDRDPRQLPAESFFETDFYRFLRQQSPHPGMVFQHEVFDEGRFIARLDVAFPAQKVGVEAHSVRWHASSQRVRRDAERHNRLTALGWRILYETYDTLKARPQEILDRLARLLQETS